VSGQEKLKGVYLFMREKLINDEELVISEKRIK
jgi:hypothetical protein